MPFTALLSINYQLNGPKISQIMRANTRHAATLQSFKVMFCFFAIVEISRRFYVLSVYLRFAHKYLSFYLLTSFVRYSLKYSSPDHRVKKAARCEYLRNFYTDCGFVYVYTSKQKSYTWRLYFAFFFLGFLDSGTYCITGLFYEVLCYSCAYKFS